MPDLDFVIFLALALLAFTIGLFTAFVIYEWRDERREQQRLDDLVKGIRR